MLKYKYTSIEISENLAPNLIDLIKKIGFLTKKTLFVSDQKIWDNSKIFFAENFLDNFANTLLLEKPRAEEIFLSQIEEMLIKTRASSIIGFGSGTINDLCKYIAAKNQIPYAIIPSAASMNGYLSNSASISFNNHKKSLIAKPPIAVFCDLKILLKSPKRLTRAGIGDIMCFYGCWFDWLMSHKFFGTTFDAKPFDILRQKMNFFCKNYHQFKLKDVNFLRILMEILLTSGQGMAIAGGSYPASQSEHLIGHCFTMKYAKKAKKILHGEIIAITSITSSKIQKQILNYLKNSPKSLFENLKNNISTEKFNDFARQEFFAKQVVAECKNEFASKQKICSKSDIISENRIAEILKSLEKIHFSDIKLTKIFKHFGIDHKHDRLGISGADYKKCIENAKFIRNRLTCLDLIS